MPEELLFVRIVQQAQKERKYIEELQRKAEENQIRVAADRERRRQERIRQRIKEILLVVALLPITFIAFKVLVFLRLCF